MKLLRSPFLVILQTFFTQRALKGKFGSPRALQWHLDTQGTWLLSHSSTWGTQAPEGHLGTWALGQLKGTQTLWHLETRGTQGTLFSRLNWNRVLQFCNSMSKIFRRIGIRDEAVPTTANETSEKVLKKVQSLINEAECDIPDTVIERAYCIGIGYKDRETNTSWKV